MHALADRQAFMREFALAALDLVNDARALRRDHERLAIENAQSCRELELMTLEVAARAATPLADAGSAPGSLAQMSHEIRTPAAAVVGMAELVLTTAMTAEQEEMVAAIQMSGEHLLAVVTNVLDLSKLEADQLFTVHEPLAVRRIVDEALDLVDAMTPPRVELTAHVSSDVPERILGDAVRLRQVLVNLLSNALRFTRTGEVAVAASTERGPGETRLLVISVRDTGAGIADDQLELIFEAFTQIGVAAGGTGLGLAVSRQLIERMGGSLVVESQVGAGSTFTLRVPLAAAAAQTGDGWGRNELDGLRVLVVDDHAAAAEHARELVEALGGVTRVAATPDAAVVIAEDGIDVLLLDESFHQRVLHDLPALARAGAGWPELPVVLLRESRAKGTALPGFDIWVRKPARRAHLLRALLAATATATGGAQRPARAGGSMVDPSTAERWPLTILVADDNPSNRRVAVRQLQLLGYAPDEAVDGAEVIRAVHRAAYDLVLMDIQMPEIDGIEAALRVRRSDAHQPRIVVLSASPFDDTPTLRAQTQIDDFLNKPLRMNDVVHVVRDAYEHVSRGAA